MRTNGDGTTDSTGAPPSVGYHLVVILPKDITLITTPTILLVILSGWDTMDIFVTTVGTTFTAIIIITLPGSAVTNIGVVAKAVGITRFVDSSKMI